MLCVPTLHCLFHICALHINRANPAYVNNTRYNHHTCSAHKHQNKHQPPSPTDQTIEASCKTSKNSPMESNTHEKAQSSESKETLSMQRYCTPTHTAGRFPWTKTTSKTSPQRRIRIRASGQQNVTIRQKESALQSPRSQQDDIVCARDPTPALRGGGSGKKVSPNLKLKSKLLSLTSGLGQSYSTG